MRLAACRYPLEPIPDRATFARKQRRLLHQARAAGADLAVLPEYLAHELAPCLPGPRGDLGTDLSGLQDLLPWWLDLYRSLAAELGLTVLAGTFPVRQPDGSFRNRAHLIAPDGGMVVQDKLHLTAFERGSGCFSGGDAPSVCAWQGRTVGIAVCYDAEFPLTVRAQRVAGARLLLVPSCTDTAAGATRVRVGCLARALENRLFVVCAVTAGSLPGNPALDSNTGQAAILAPMDLGLPDDGVLAATAPDDSNPWAVATVDVDGLADARRPAEVANDRDWDRQLAMGAAHVQAWA